MCRRTRGGRAGGRQDSTSFAPTATSVAASTRRSSPSGARADRWLPTTIPGTDPISSDTSIAQSTEPSIQCPTPATSVSGTACAMSEPTMRVVDSAGYSSSRTVTPIAPAPTEVSDTSTPSTAPVSTVAASVRVGLGGSARVRFAANAASCGRNSSDSDVSSNAAPSTNWIIRLVSCECMPCACRNHSVIAAAGTLPAARRPVIRHSTVPLSPCTKVPVALVSAA
ncbi:hypothetical protein BURPS1710b_3197 [Burkholderia pseudomallei 1710b]|uniref:Uncharacterized protein n=1 Tax=Burkholderia pseudomallei (strain 1710b) TaxID=320372 RepID=Q3JPD4_BURP1|nr:hypothetical protein BURPS1710b_3197 [Burkholderia pseudomallei 1710b]